MIRRPPRSTQSRSSAASDVYKRQGQDRYDEVWEGDYHVVPGPSSEHAFVDSQLARLLWPRAEQAGLSVTTAFNLGEPDDYRVPDGGVHRNCPSGVFVATTAMVVEVAVSYTHLTLPT